MAAKHIWTHLVQWHPGYICVGTGVRNACYAGWTKAKLPWSWLPWREKRMRRQIPPRLTAYSLGATGPGPGSHVIPVENSGNRRVRPCCVGHVQCSWAHPANGLLLSCFRPGRMLVRPLCSCPQWLHWNKLETGVSRVAAEGCSKRLHRCTSRVGACEWAGGALKCSWWGTLLLWCRYALNVDPS